MVNTDKAIEVMSSMMFRGVKYSMYGSRNGTDGTADCSGALSYALMIAGASQLKYLPSTESMHSWLIDNGYKLIAFNKEWDMQKGDVLIFGIKGKSAGAGGHTALAIDHNRVIHCNYSHNGVSIDNETTMPYSMGWYVYRQTESSKPYQPNPFKVDWIKEDWHFVTGTWIYLRTEPSTSSKVITKLNPNTLIKYDAYCYKDGYVWLRQPRANGTYGYLASGECVGTSRTSYFGSFA